MSEPLRITFDEEVVAAELALEAAETLHVVAMELSPADVVMSALRERGVAKKRVAAIGHFFTPGEDGADTPTIDEVAEQNGVASQTVSRWMREDLSLIADSGILPDDVHWQANLRRLRDRNARGYPWRTRGMAERAVQAALAAEAGARTEADEAAAIVATASSPTGNGTAGASTGTTSSGQPKRDGQAATGAREVLHRARQTESEFRADGVRQYLNAIGRTPLLNAEQEVELGKRIEVGLYARHLLDKAAANGAEIEPARRRDLQLLSRDGERAKDHLLEANLRLVVSVAKRYTGRGMPLADIIQEGNLGLVRAVEKFDYTKGYKFSTYATWWIRQCITKGMAEYCNMIRLPMHMVDEAASANRARRELAYDLGRDPTDEEVAESIGMKPERLRQIRYHTRGIVSTDMKRDDQDEAFGDFIQEDDDSAYSAVRAAEEAQKQDRLAEALGSLAPREAEVVKLRMGISTGDGRPLSDEQIARRFSWTLESVRRTGSVAMSKLMHPSRSQRLLDFLPG